MAVREVFDGLDRVEAILSKQRYLTGPTLTEADVRLFTSLIRFDSVYFTHFKVRLRVVSTYYRLLVVSLICHSYNLHFTKTFL